MSLLLIELVPQGIIFGADRNITIERVKVRHEESQDGTTFIEERHEHRCQSPRPKVLRWPQRKALIGYVGEAQINNVPTDEWLYDFIGDHLQFDSFETLAESLRRSVERQRRIDEGDNDPAPIIIHLAGFEEREGIQVPAVWVIRNDHSRRPQYLSDIRKEFEKADCIWEERPWQVTPRNIRNVLSEQANLFKPLWFHQRYDLGTFNLLEAFLKDALKYLYQRGPLNQQCPQSLLDWEKQVRVSTLMYGAYFQAYMDPDEQYVGGGVDTVSIPWPE
jgi:hypothetical protein